jgi:hypothetical protein
VTIFGLLLSCNHADNTKASLDTTSFKQGNDTTQTKSQRHLLIEELKRLHAIFGSKEREKIADVFPFPLADTILSIYLDDSSYLEQFRKNGNKTTRALFIKYFPQVYRDLQLEQFNQLFKYIIIDSLNSKDTLVQEITIKNEPCYKFYHVYIDKDMVTLEFGTNSNKTYVDKSKKSEDDESFGDECEFVSLWLFHFDGTKLHFVKQMVAG